MDGNDRPCTGYNNNFIPDTGQRLVVDDDFCHVNSLSIENLKLRRNVEYLSGLSLDVHK
jgi:hypothetical protein